MFSAQPVLSFAQEVQCQSPVIDMGLSVLKYAVFVMEINTMSEQQDSNIP